MQTNETVVRKGRRWAALLCCVAAVALVGCTLTPTQDPCNVAGVCDDDDACTVDTCFNLNGVAECTNTPVDCSTTGAGFVCNPADGECVECLADADCDNGDFCDGEETCVSNACVDGTAPDCEFGCDEANDTCFECAEDADCEDDGLFCTGDPVCTDGACGFSGNPCDAGDTCDEDAEECVPPAPECVTDDDCDVDEVCSNGVCEPAPVEPCTTDADCDDGLFCNGDEVCGTNGICSNGVPACDEETETCAEGDAGAVCTPIPVTAIVFTLGQDSLSGTSGGDVFSAPLEFNAGTGAQVPTLQNGDSANGLAGTDTLNATYLNGGGGTIAPSLTGIEIWNLSDFGGTATTISGANATGVTAINSVNSLANVTVTNVGSLVNLGVTNSAFDLLVTMIAPATNANDDASTLTLSGAKAGCTVGITTPVNGIETLNIVSGGSANTLDAITQTTGTTLATVNVSGDQDLTVTGDLPNTVTTLNGGTATGDTSFSVAAGNVTYTGGSGDDYVNFAGTYTTADTINGGTGTNTLGLNSAQAAAATNQSNVTNINTVRIVDALADDVTVSRFGANDVILDTTAAATDLTASGQTVTLPSGARTATLNNDDTAHTLGLTIAGSATNDSLTVNLQNADLGNTLTVTGAETVGLVSGNGSDGTAADGNANTGTAITLAPTFGTGTLNLTGSVAVTLTGAVTAGTIDASGLGAAFTMGATTGATANITGSAFADTLFGSANGDSINGGAGNDTIRGVGAADLITTGDGNDTLVFEATAAANGLDIINDFSSTDILNVSAFATDNSPTATVADNATGNQAVANNNIFVVTDADGSTDTAAEVAALFGGGGKPFAAGVADMQVVLLIVDQSTGGGTAVWYIDDADSNTTVAAGECVQVATLSNYQGSFVDANITD